MGVTVNLIVIAGRVVTIGNNFKSGLFLNGNSTHFNLAGALEQLAGTHIWRQCDQKCVWIITLCRDP